MTRGPRAIGTRDGASVHAVDLEGPGGLSATVFEYGAVLQRLSLRSSEGAQTALVRGFDTLGEYVANRSFVGRIVGRYANRIARGRFSLDGVPHQLTLNERATTHLHGGATGFWHRVWRIVEHTGSSVTLELVSPAGDEGYPGAVTARCTYALQEPASLAVTLSAATTAPTIVNLACHSYFCLDETGSTRDLDLQVDADSYTPVDQALIPTGAVAPTAGTPYDFRVSRWLGTQSTPLDINYVLAKPAGTLGRAARISSRRTGLGLEVFTTEPGLQVYDGHLLPAGPGWMRPYAGMCLEGQRFPDSPNRPDFPSSVLRPDAPYEQITQYKVFRT